MMSNGSFSPSTTQRMDSALEPKIEALSISGIVMKDKRGNHSDEKIRDTDNETSVKPDDDGAGALDRGWGWAVVFSAFLANIIVGGLDKSNGIMYLQFLRTYRRSAAATAWVIALFVWFRHLFAPLTTAMCNQFSCRLVVALGAIPCTVGVLLSGFVADLNLMYITYGVVTGLGMSMTVLPPLISVNQFFDKRRGLAVGLATFGASAGAVVFPPFIEITFEKFGFVSTFMMLAGVVSHFLLCGILLRPIDLHFALCEKSKPIEDPIAIIEKVTDRDFKSNYIQKKRLKKRHLSQWISKPDAKKSKIINFSLLKDAVFACFCIQSFLFFISFSIVYGFLPALATEKGLSSLQSSYLISIIGGVDSVSRIGLSAAMDHERVRPYRLRVYTLVIFITGLVTVIMPSCEDFWQFAVLGALYGISSGTYVAESAIALVEIYGVEQFPSTLGFVNFGNGLSQFVFHTVGGAMKDVFGNYWMAFYMGSLGLLLSGVTMAIGNVLVHRRNSSKYHLNSGRELKQ